MMDKKFIARFVAVTTAASFAYCGYLFISDALSEPTPIVRPTLLLTTGEEIDPANAPATTKFVKETAAAFAQEIFGDAEEAPDLNEFLSRFTCSACGKRCLLTSPRCNKGEGSQEKAIVIYQEMFPEVELFVANGETFSIRF